MRLLLLAALAFPLLADVSPAAPLRGVLDTSFGEQGRIRSSLGEAFVSSRFNGMVRQADGKLVLIGSVGRRLVVERRHPGGTLDASFGEGGVVTVPKGDALTGLAVDAQGRVLFGVPSEASVCSGGRVHRLLPNGEPDPSFGVDGVSENVLPTVRHLALDATGRILVAGRAATAPCGKSIPPTELAVARLTPDGKLDRSFGAEGVFRFHRESEYTGFASAVAVREDGTILVTSNYALLGLTADGALDPGFGSGGIVDMEGSPRALVALPGGGVLLAASSVRSFWETCCRDRGDLVVSRYRPDGSPDPGFGAAGTVVLDIGPVDDPTALASTADGGVVVAGSSGEDPDECRARPCPVRLVLARLDSAGVLDPSFGERGWTYLSIPGEPGGYSFEPRLSGLVVAPEGRIVAAGDAGSYYNAFVIARLENGQPDPAFGNGGLVAEVPTKPSHTRADGLAIDSSGRILVSGWSNADSYLGRGLFLTSKRDGLFEPPDHARDGTRGTLWGSRGEKVYSFDARAVTRLDSGGRLDHSYGSEGIARLPAGFRAVSLDVRRNGAAVVAGRHVEHPGMAAFALTAGGVRDTRFGNRGLAVVRRGGEGRTEARSVAFDRAGRVILFGRAGGESLAARLSPGGRLDRGFAGGNRFRRLPFSGFGETGIAMQRDGKVLLGGRAAAANARWGPLLMLRLNPGGGVDRSFGRDGTVRTGARGRGLSLFASHRQIVLVHARRYGGVVLRAYEPDGAIDRQFGRRGITVFAGRKPREFQAAAAARQPDGRIVVAATRRGAGGGSFIELLRVR